MDANVDPERGPDGEVFFGPFDQGVLRENLGSPSSSCKAWEVQDWIGWMCQHPERSCSQPQDDVGSAGSRVRWTQKFCVDLRQSFFRSKNKKRQ